jgi:hypothetical protein
MPFHAMVVFTLGYDFLFKSTVGHCELINNLLEEVVIITGYLECTILQSGCSGRLFSK